MSAIRDTRGSVARITLPEAWNDARTGTTNALFRLYYVISNKPLKQMCWQYVADVAEQPLSTVRREFEKLENAGLIVRTLTTAGQGASRHATGFTLRFTALGKDALFAQFDLASKGLRLDQRSQAVLQAADANAQARECAVVDTPPAIEPEALTRSDRDVMRALATEKPQVHAAMVEAFAGAEISVALLCAAGADEQLAPLLERMVHDARSLHQATRARALVAALPSAEDKYATSTAARSVEEALANCMQRGLRLPQVKCDDPKLRGLADMAQLVVREASAFAPSLLHGPELRRRVAEVVYAVTTGVLADAGEPLRRVRAALKLWREGRWSTPNRFDASFAGPFLAGVRFA